MAKRWFPGHYIQAFDYGSRSVLVDSEMDLVTGNANFSGVMGAAVWSDIEPTPGAYNLSKIVEALDRAHSRGLKVWIRLKDRAFQGNTFGQLIPSYIYNAPYGVFYDQQGSENIVAPKLWESAVGERYILWLEAMASVCDDHPAFQGFMTEEYAIQGAFRQPGFTELGMRQFWNNVAQRLSPKLESSLLHVNTGWASEQGVLTRTEASLGPYSDFLVSQDAGLGPTDLRLTGATATEATDFGKFIFRRHAGQTFFLLNYEWPDYDDPTPIATLIDYAVDTLRCHFICWDPDRRPKSAYGGLYDWFDVLAAINAASGKRYTSKPTSVSKYDGNVEEPPDTRPPIIMPTIGSFMPKLTSGQNTFGLRDASLPSAPKALRPRRRRLNY